MVAVGGTDSAPACLPPIFVLFIPSYPKRNGVCPLYLFSFCPLLPPTHHTPFTFCLSFYLFAFCYWPLAQWHAMAMCGVRRHGMPYHYSSHQSLKGPVHTPSSTGTPPKNALIRHKQAWGREALSGLLCYILVENNSIHVLCCVSCSGQAAWRAVEMPMCDYLFVHTQICLAAAAPKLHTHTCSTHTTTPHTRTAHETPSLPTSPTYLSAHGGRHACFTRTAAGRARASRITRIWQLSLI